jgi:ABC-type amino acid transport substrate-binding protein
MPVPAIAGDVWKRIQASQTVRVCIWPNYYSITYRSPRDQKLTGIDIDLSAALAKDLKVTLSYVDSSFVNLISDLQSDVCDVAMFGVGVTPQRQSELAFSNPYLRSGIYGVTTRSNRRIQDWDDIDQPGILVGVQAGTFMEPVMASALQRAELVRIKSPQTREQELEAGRIDIFMTDYPYSRRILSSADWARLVVPRQPFNEVNYGYAIKKGDDAWLNRLNRFVADIKRDGRLAEAAGRSGLSEILIKN